uniref:Uncharacterized protein n=1 Tax=Xenopus tropicalis TaxID=8364 RepID=A0A803JRH8_XENTR
HLHQGYGGIYQHILRHIGHAILHWDPADLPDVYQGHIVVLILNVKDHCGLVSFRGLPPIPGHDSESQLIDLLPVYPVQDTEPTGVLVQPEESSHRLGCCPKHILDLPVYSYVVVGGSQLQDRGAGGAVLCQVRLVHAFLEPRVVVIDIGDEDPENGLGGSGRFSPVSYPQGELIGIPLFPVQRPLHYELRLLLPIRGVGHLQLENAAPTVRLHPPLARVQGALCRPPSAGHIQTFPRVLDQLVALYPIPAEVSVGGRGQQIQSPHRPVLLYSEGEHRGWKSRGVIVDVQNDHPTLKQLHPALRRPDHRHLKVYEALVLIEDHLALRQLLPVYSALCGAQLPGHVVNLKVVGTGLQAEGHVPGAFHDPDLLSHIADPHIGRTFLRNPVLQQLFGGGQSQGNLQQEQPGAPATRYPLSPHDLPPVLNRTHRGNSRFVVLAS